jgi:hypothetical protein
MALNLLDFAGEQERLVQVTDRGWAMRRCSCLHRISILVLLEHGASQNNLTRPAMFYVARILRGAKPADLPVEQPTKFQSVILAQPAPPSHRRRRSNCWSAR